MAKVDQTDGGVGANLIEIKRKVKNKRVGFNSVVRLRQACALSRSGTFSHLLTLVLRNLSIHEQCRNSAIIRGWIALSHAGEGCIQTLDRTKGDEMRTRKRTRIRV